jgi:hypothetical protein
MSTVTANVTALSAKVSLSRNSRTNRISAAKPRAAARRGFVCKAEATNGDGAYPRLVLTPLRVSRARSLRGRTYPERKRRAFLQRSRAIASACTSRFSHPCSGSNPTDAPSTPMFQALHPS